MGITLEGILIEELAEKIEIVKSELDTLGEQLNFEYWTSKKEDGLPASNDMYREKVLPAFNDLIDELNKIRTII
jgi:hypothetical protein